MVLDRIARLAHQRGGHLLLDVDHVVGHQPVPPDHEVEGALALADPALAEEKNADTEHVHQDAVDVRGGEQALLEELGDQGDEGG